MRHLSELSARERESLWAIPLRELANRDRRYIPLSQFMLWKNELNDPRVQKPDHRLNVVMKMVQMVGWWRRHAQTQMVLLPDDEDHVRMVDSGVPYYAQIVSSESTSSFKMRHGSARRRKFMRGSI